VIYQGINQILNGTPAKNVLPGMQSKLNQIIKQSSSKHRRSKRGRMASDILPRPFA
jgi:hypothetical protein